MTLGLGTLWSLFDMFAGDDHHEAVLNFIVPGAPRLQSFDDLTDSMAKKALCFFAPTPLSSLSVSRRTTRRFGIERPTRPKTLGGRDTMRTVAFALCAMMLSAGGNAMAQDRIVISSDWGRVTATLEDNAASKALLEMLPLTIEMRDHLRQEKTGFLPRNLPSAPRQVDFRNGSLGLWSANHFVIYYREGRVPQPGIVLLGQVQGDAAIFDRPGSVTVRVERAR